MILREDHDMARDVEPSAMSNYGDTFAEALELFLDNVMGLVSNPETGAVNRSARFQAEASSLPELARSAFDAVTALADAFELAVTHVAVDGYRSIEGGHRSWGTVELAPRADSNDWLEIVDGPNVSRDADDGRWRIDVWFVGN